MSRPEERDPERMSFSKVGFLEFIAIGIICTVMMEWKSQQIDVVVTAADKYLDVRDISAEIYRKLREWVTS